MSREKFLSAVDSIFGERGDEGPARIKDIKALARLLHDGPSDDGQTAAPVVSQAELDAEAAESENHADAPRGDGEQSAEAGSDKTE